MSGPVVVVSRTSCSSGIWRYGPMSTVSIRAVRAATLPLSPGGFLAIWLTATTLMPALSLTPWDCEAWRTYPGWEVAELHTRSRFLMRGYWADRYFLGERVYDTPVAPARRRVPHAPPRHMCLLEGLTREDLEVEYRGFSANDFLSVGDFSSYFASRMQARLPEVLEYTQAFRNQVSTFVQSISDDLWRVPPMNQLAWLKYFKDLKPNYGFLSWLIIHFNPNTMVFRFEDSEVTPTYEEMCAIMDYHPDQDETPALPPGPRYDLTEIVALCPVFLPDGVSVDQGLPLEPFLNRVLSTDLDLPWIRACCFLLLNVDIALHITDFNVHHHGCPLLLQAWALDKLSLIPSVPARLIPTYGAAIFQSRSRRRFEFGDNPTILWICPWWRVRLVTTGSMNLNYVLYASLDRSMAYFPDRISRQYGMIQRVPRVHNFESGLITSHLLTNLADRWRNRNTVYLDEGTM
ncbi:hypothetical protein JCGZ_02873 [Jatropha curcas]|uniref:Aminotransferase-like plant mobile domain-containing protein n=1 Tax=Jatropha curcas TaxID=180498 RepID=A0A067L560_JATCU|nr:hypothetical protein JCGZ_02873 [Jatropha curcas]